MSGPIFLASARLLLARLSHSRGSSGGRRLRPIDNPSFFQGRANHQTVRMAIALHLLGSDNHDIDGGLGLIEMMVNQVGEALAMELAALDDEEIQIAMR